MSAAREAEAGSSKGEDKAAEDVGRIRGEIDATRRQVERYIEEVERRRREMTDVRLQARRHPALVVGVGIIVAAAVGGAVLKSRRARDRRAVSRLRSALGILAGKTKRPETPRKRNGGRLVGLIVKAAVPLGMALAKSLLARGAAAMSPPRIPPDRR
ncbi:MAG: hypothetical protein ABI768_01175 [Acidobacteriota bacterium]